MSEAPNNSDDMPPVVEGSSLQSPLWMTPIITRMRAGDAEMPGPNPLRPEGLAQGS